MKSSSKKLIFILFSAVNFTLYGQIDKIKKDTQIDIAVMKAFSYSPYVKDILDMEDEDLDEVTEGGIFSNDLVLAGGFKYKIKFIDSCPNSTDIFVQIANESFKPTYKLILVEPPIRIYNDFEVDLSNYPKPKKYGDLLTIKSKIKVENFKGPCKYLTVEYKKD